ncbi:hypothetical protein [Acuticoccus sp. I52.16.1]|uniref:hypothetical protein n=1 Tax=Acuticoccus sp. I52.16.1 TaxID=2928472 RepID=UPI001FD554B9|nr:hypothetical protein [Acuticoccus sp. I52.16.1]UOM34193.1 hypothetical protein MRB58_20575 [Acuticoccus sp. I52.16.1]
MSETAAPGVRRPIVVTSLNPFAKFARQRRCWDAWAGLGLTVRTANVAAEAERLIAAGIARETILEVAEADSGRALFGKPTPRIAPLLAHLADALPERDILLTNSDIFPATRSADVTDIYLSQAPLAALVREETATYEASAFAARAPYRGGLDTFLIGAARLPAVNAALAQTPGAERMCFGIPGWDYLVGALMLSLGGIIMDAGVLLHESHETTYANVDEFLAYVPAMQALGAAKGPSAAEAAFQFFQRIDHECRMTGAASRLARLKYYRQPTAVTTDGARAATARFLAACPFIAPTVNFAVLAALADDLAAEADMERAINVFTTGAGAQADFRAALAATVFALLCRGEAPPRAPKPGDKRHTQKAAALTQVDSRDDWAERRAVARFYAAERVTHGIHNRAVYDYLILAAENDAERALVAMLNPMTPVAEALPDAA